MIERAFKVVDAKMRSQFVHSLGGAPIQYRIGEEVIARRSGVFASINLEIAVYRWARVYLRGRILELEYDEADVLARYSAGVGGTIRLSRVLVVREVPFEEILDVLPRTQLTGLKLHYREAILERARARHERSPA